MSEFVSIERPDDETIEVHVNGVEIASANHDEHGWSGMGAVERTALAVAGALGAEIRQWRATYGETALRDAQKILAERDSLRALAEAAQQWARRWDRPGTRPAQPEDVALLDVVRSLNGDVCSNCAPGYDCERGIYTPTAIAPVGEPTGCEREGGEPR